MDTSASDDNRPSAQRELRTRAAAVNGCIRSAMGQAVPGLLNLWVNCRELAAPIEYGFDPRCGSNLATKSRGQPQRGEIPGPGLRALDFRISPRWGLPI